MMLQPLRSKLIILDVLPLPENREAGVDDARGPGEGSGRCDFDRKVLAGEGNVV